MLKCVLLLLFLSACLAANIPTPSWENYGTPMSHLKQYAHKTRMHTRVHPGFEEVERAKAIAVDPFIHVFDGELEVRQTNDTEDNTTDDDDYPFDKEAPEGWLCPNYFYNNTDGCDCDCGVYDPDCNDANAEIYNCGNPSSFNCSLEGECQLLVPPPEEWFCPDFWYGTKDGCDCSCGGEDPDCEDEGVQLYGCGNLQNTTCYEGECVTIPPRGWKCDPSYYNATDGCDCNCGIQDPDCENKKAVVYNCESIVDSPYVCIKGACFQDFKPAAKLTLGGDVDVQIIGACGKTIGWSKVIDGNTRFLPIVVAILNENDELYETGTFKIIAKVRKVDPNANIILAGETVVESFKGFAVFNGLIALGKDGDQFYLQFESDPPLIPVISTYSVRLKVGNPAYINISTSNPLNEFGFVKVPSNSNSTVVIRFMDACGNRVKNTTGILCTAQNMDNFADYSDVICSGLAELNEQFNGTNSNFTDPDDGEDGEDGDDGEYFDEKRNIVNKFIPNGVSTQLSFPSRPGIYDIHLFGINNTEIATTLTFQVIERGEYECYSLEEAGKITAKDIQVFHDSMIDNPTKLNLSLTLFSADSDRPNIMKFTFKENPNTSPFHSKLNITYSKWVLSAKHFFVEQDPVFLKVISLALVDVNPIKVEVNLQRPFCKSVPGDVQRNVFGLWVFEMADRYANLATLKYLPINTTDKAVQSTQDVVCYEHEQEFDFTCCGRQTFINFRFPGDCEVPRISAISIALIVLSVIFALVATIYATTLVAVFFQQSGVIYTVIEDVKGMPDNELSIRKRFTLLQIVFGPTLVILGLVQNVVLLDLGPAIFVGAVFAGIAAYWWIISTIRFFVVYVQIKEPGRRIDEAFFVAVLLLTFFSLFNVLLTFAWVALGLLLNPGRVVSYFVGFLTIFSVAVLKLNSLAQLLKSAEKGIIKNLLEKNVDPAKIKSDERESKIEDEKGSKKDEPAEPDWEALVTEALEMRGPKLTEFFQKNGMSNKAAEDSSKRVESFRRFRVRFLIGDLIGTLAILTCLIVFILLGVEAFRTKSAAVSSVGSVMEGVAGAGTAANDKLGEKEDTVNNLIGRFAKSKTRGVNLSDIANDSIAMNILGNQ